MLNGYIKKDGQLVRINPNQYTLGTGKVVSFTSDQWVADGDRYKLLLPKSISGVSEIFELQSDGAYAKVILDTELTNDNTVLYSEAGFEGYCILGGNVVLSVDSVGREISSELDSKVNKSGDTMTGSLLFENDVPNTNTYFLTRRSDTNTEVCFGVGNGGENRGIFDSSAQGGNKWLIYNNNQGYPMLAQSPATSDKSTKIATTAYTREALKTYSSMPSSSSFDIDATKREYISPSEGYVRFYGTVSAGGGINLQTGQFVINSNNLKSSGTSWCDACCPVAKGHKVTITVAGTITGAGCKFIYAQSEV